MRTLIATIILSAGLLLSGCSTTKSLSRTPQAANWFEANYDTGTGAHEFAGKLDLIYEKRVKGAVDSPFLFSDGYMGFKTTKDRVIILDRENGSQKGYFTKRHGIVLNPVIIDSILYIVRQVPYGLIQKIDIFTGDAILERPLSILRSGPILVGDNLIYGTTDGLIALDRNDLSTIWQMNELGLVDIEPVTDGETIFAVTGADTIIAVDPSDQSIMWTARVEGGIGSSLSPGSCLYLGTTDGTVRAIDMTDGTTKWTIPLGFPVHGEFAEYDGRIYFGCTDRRIYCIDAATGETIWKYMTNGVVTARPAVFGKAVIVGSLDRTLYSLDRHSGTLIDSLQLEGPVTATAAMIDQRIFVACRGNHVYCFEGNSTAR